MNSNTLFVIRNSLMRNKSYKAQNIKKLKGYIALTLRYSAVEIQRNLIPNRQLREILFIAISKENEETTEKHLDLKFLKTGLHYH